MEIAFTILGAVILIVFGLLAWKAITHPTAGKIKYHHQQHKYGNHKNFPRDYPF